MAKFSKNQETRRHFQKKLQNCQKLEKIEKLFEEVTKLSEIKESRNFTEKVSDFRKDVRK